MSTDLKEDPLQRYEQFRSNPWLFLQHCVYTHDEVDADTPIKPFPCHLEYLNFLVLMWLDLSNCSKDKRKMAIPKSRRMTASWTFIALAVWDVLFHKGRSWALISKKENDSSELVKRAEFIINHIPENMISKALIPKMKRGMMQTSPPAIVFEGTYSKIEGFPQGANQLRQRGFSGILEDECAFWEEAEDSYAAAEPTIKGGGRMVMISSRAVEDGGFFKRICFDKLDAKDTRFPEIPPVEPHQPMEGIQFWKNPNNGFTVIDIHYTADPAKRGDTFREGLKKSLPIRKYRMEYEKSWETFEGKPVYEDFNERIHLTHARLQAIPGLPLLLGWDSSGLTPACIIAQFQEDRLFILREHIGIGMGAVRFVPHVSAELKLEFPWLHDLAEQTISFIDPAGLKKSETNEKTYLQYIYEGGFKQVRPGPLTWEKRKSSVDEMLTTLTGGQSKILIYEQGCPILTAGFKGGYRYSDKIADSEPDKVRPVKDIHSHPHDGLQYLCGGIKNYKREHYNYEIPIPTYGFQKTADITPTTKKNYGRTVNGR